MVLNGANPATARRPQHHGAGQPAARPRAQPRGVVHHLIKCRIDESGELNLGDRPKSLCRQADRQAGDRPFGQWRVDYPALPESGLQSIGRAKDATIPSDILAQHDNGRVLLHGA